MVVWEHQESWGTHCCKTGWQRKGSAGSSSSPDTLPRSSEQSLGASRGASEQRDAHITWNLPALWASGKRLPLPQEEPGELAVVFSQGSFSGAAGSLIVRSPRNQGPDWRLRAGQGLLPWKHLSWGLSCPTGRKERRAFIKGLWIY